MYLNVDDTPSSGVPVQSYDQVLAFVNKARGRFL